MWCFILATSADDSAMIISTLINRNMHHYIKLFPEKTIDLYCRKEKKSTKVTTSCSNIINNIWPYAWMDILHLRDTRSVYIVDLYLQRTLMTPRDKSQRIHHHKHIENKKYIYKGEKPWLISGFITYFASIYAYVYTHTHKKHVSWRWNWRWKAKIKLITYLVHRD